MTQEVSCTVVSSGQHRPQSWAITRQGSPDRVKANINEKLLEKGFNSCHTAISLFHEQSSQHSYTYVVMLSKLIFF